MKPYYDHAGITIYHGDCREIVRDLYYDCVLSDPPWGTNTATNSRRFTRKTSERARELGAVLREPLTVFKLTDQRMTTYGGFQWRLGEVREAAGMGPLCAGGWLHVYRHPDCAVLLNPIHAQLIEPRLFAAEATGLMLAEALKAGVSRLALREELPVPEFTVRERVAWSIFVVRAIPGRALIPPWEQWAADFLDSSAMSVSDASATGSALRAKVRAAARTAKVGAAELAARAAEAAARAAEAKGVELDLDAAHSQFREWRKEARRGSSEVSA